MRIAGFNFTKVVAERSPDFEVGSNISTNIEFVDIKNEETDITREDSNALRVSFKFSVSYNEKDKKDSNNAEISFLGFIIIITTKDEANDILKEWKKKALPNSFRVPIFSFILKRCSARALQLEDELNLPLHVPIPQIKMGNSEGNK